MGKDLYEERAGAVDDTEYIHGGLVAIPPGGPEQDGVLLDLGFLVGMTYNPIALRATLLFSNGGMRHVDFSGDTERCNVFVEVVSAALERKVQWQEQERAQRAAMAQAVQRWAEQTAEPNEEDRERFRNEVLNIVHEDAHGRVFRQASDAGIVS